MTTIPKPSTSVSDSSRPHTVVVGYDGSPASRASLVLAAQRASERGRVVIVHAFELPASADWPEYGSELARRHDLGQALLDDLPLGDPELAGPEYALELIGGSQTQAIVAAARTWSADEIVVGASSDAEGACASSELRDTAPCPVVVIVGDA
jgi:Universal stress protein family